MPASLSFTITRPASRWGALSFTLLYLALAPPACPRREAPSEPRFTFAFSTARGRYDCSPPAADSGTESFVGSVLRPTALSFEIDTCLPTADCKATVSPAITLHGPGLPPLDRHLPSGAFVQLTVESRRGKACAQRLLLTTVERWHGVKSPASQSFVLAGNNGISKGFDDAPFSVTPEPKGCRLQLSAKGLAKPVTVPPSSDPLRWQTPAGQTWTVWNGSSSPDGTCSAESDWTYWIASSSANNVSKVRSYSTPSSTSRSSAASTALFSRQSGSRRTFKSR